MKRKLTVAFLIMLLSHFAYGQLFPDLGGQRVGTSAAQFLKIGMGARGIGMGESFIAVVDDAEALYWNPAGLAQFDRTAVFFSHNEWLIDTSLEFAGAVFHAGANSFGASITYLHTEEMVETTELQPFGTGRMFGFSDFLFGLSYARRMTNQFSFGLTTKFMQETLAEITMRAVLFDLGTYYDTGWQSIRFAVVVSNFGQDMKPSGDFTFQDFSNESVTVDDFQSFAPPIMFRIGVAAEIVETENHAITSSVQLNHPNDNAENVNLGVEYRWQDMIAFRAGYKTAQIEESYSLGFGLNVPITMADFRLDYAFTDFGRLGTVNRFGIQLQF